MRTDTINGLVLSRAPGQRIALDVPGHERIWVSLIETRGRLARIGIAAPAAVVIQREEILPEEDAG